MSEVYRKLESQYFGEEMHEKAEIERLPELLTEVQVFIDVGASLGQYAYFANRILENAEIYCIEPDPFKVKRLQELVNCWQKASSNRFYVIPMAVSDRRGTETFYVPTDHDSSGAFFPVPQSQTSWMEMEVQCLPLDDLFRGKRVDFIKIDVEGAEHRVLRGAERVLREGNVRVLLEVAPWGDPNRGYRPSDVFRLMARFGYTFRIVEQHWLFSKAYNRSLVSVKSALMGFILDRPFLKGVLKGFLLWARRIRRRSR